MRLDAHHFGTLDVDDGNILFFPSGLPEFPEHLRFALLERPQERPIRWLQAVDDPTVAFAVVDPQVIRPDYSPHFSPSELELLQLSDPEEAEILAILVLDRDPENITANLRAPLLLNPERKLGAQAILREEWPRKHPLVQGVRQAANGS